MARGRKPKKGTHKRLMSEFKDMWSIFVKSRSNRRVWEMVNHPRNANIALSGRSFRVGKKGSSVQYTGLTHRLHDEYWPDTEEDPEKNKGPKRTPLYKKEHYVPSKGLKKECKTWGHKHGTRVHSQINKFVKKLTSGKKISVTKYTDPCTLRVLNLLASKRWVPVSAELPIYDEESRVATAIDILVFDINKKEIIMLELKTGYESEVSKIEPFFWS